MKKGIKAMIAVAAVGAASVGAALLFRNKTVTLNVSALEKSVLVRYPNAIITGIEKSFDDQDIYTVKVILDENEYKIFVTVKGEIISSNPNIPEEFESVDDEE